MKNKIQILGVLLFAAFSFFYTDKVSKIIRKNDPIMNSINNVKDNYVIKITEPIIMNDEYIEGINGCVVDEELSYKKMKEAGLFKEELLVMKEDKIEIDSNKYIIGGNKKNRNISIILSSVNNNLDKYIKDNNISINYFLDVDYINNNIAKLIELSKYSKIYNYGRNREYLSKYIKYDNALIKSNFLNDSNYCLLTDKNDDYLDICNKHNMKVIKPIYIKDDIVNGIKSNLGNGKMFYIESNEYEKIEYIIKYIETKGYKIVFLDELLSTNNSCN